MTNRPVLLCILDGFGWGEDTPDNAVSQAATPVFDALWQRGPRAFLKASGEAVGLPAGQIGNSEVGHLTIGAGRVVLQDLPRIGKSIADGSLRSEKALTDLIAKLKDTGGTCHLMGLVSPGGVHSHQNHLIALARLLNAAGIPTAFHAFTDGRDVGPRTGASHIATLQVELSQLKKVHLRTVCGRYLAMDRDHRWERVERAYRLITEPAASGGGAMRSDLVAAIEASYDRDVTDEFITPIADPDYAGIVDGDAILMGNFRSDRVRELLTAFLDPAFDGFDRPRAISFSTAVGMVPYSDALTPFIVPVFAPQRPENGLGETVAKAGLTQLRAAETEKYPHVTFFLNGGREAPYEGEDRILIASPKVATYDLQPEMSAPELAEKVSAAIRKQAHDLIVVNFANPDMVGHTGDFAAVIKAVEAADTGLGQLLDALETREGIAFVTADHGNAEQMKDPVSGGPHTAHTTNPVPAVLAGRTEGIGGLRDGGLADIAPTLLTLLGLDQPDAMTGTPLLVLEQAATGTDA